MLTLLSNAHVFAPAELGQVHLLIAGGRIVWIGTDAPAAELNDRVTERLDLGGAIVIPGLVDTHAHTTGGGGEAGAETRVPAPGFSSLARHGVTSVIGMLGTDSATRSMSELLSQTRALRTLGLSAWCLTGGYHVPPCTLTGSLRGDLVHLDSVVGVGELALSDFRSSQPTLDELLRIASEVQVGSMIAGKPALLHLHLGDGERGLELVREALAQSELPARLFNPTHVNRQPALFTEALDLVERGAVIDLTAFPVEDGEAALSAADALERYFASGLNPASITVSSDSGGCLPTFDRDGVMTHMDVGGAACLLATLREMLARGYALANVLPAFTSNPGRHLRLGEHLRPGAVAKGQLTLGADADLVVLNKDHKPTHVMAGGRWLVQAGAPVVRGPFEAPL